MTRLTVSSIFCTCVHLIFTVNMTIPFPPHFTPPTHLHYTLTNSPQLVFLRGMARVSPPLCAMSSSFAMHLLQGRAFLALGLPVPMT